MIGAVTVNPVASISNRVVSVARTDESQATEEQIAQARDKALMQQEVDALKARDREVRAHEQAHLAAAGQYATGGIQYTYKRGPDGRFYAVGGEVSVDTSEVPNDPEATLAKAIVLRRAALAPAEPSQQDRAVAAQMTQMAAEARQEINQATICPTCGGAHSAEAHAGVAVYAQAGLEPAKPVAIV
ncbi:MAG: putative metalloprotease CJM1_0395 family protein [Pseudomonadota bacterium]